MTRPNKTLQLGIRGHDEIQFLNDSKKRWVFNASKNSPKGMHTGGVGAAAADTTTGVLYANDNTPVVTETYIVELPVHHPCRIIGIAILNGSAVAGNVTVALADRLGVPIVGAKSASTAQSGTNGYQRIKFATAFECEGPGTYFVMVQFNNTGARYRSHKIGVHGASVATSQVYGTLLPFTPPKTFATAGSVIAGIY